MNILCGNSVRIFGGRSVFIDAANSFDPSLIVDSLRADKSEVAARKFCERITIFRAFTCYQPEKTHRGQACAKKFPKKGKSA